MSARATLETELQPGRPVLQRSHSWTLAAVVAAAAAAAAAA
eukprot:CAMPEP_0172870092 /NCGR_PEP_ID=MMETSP1075-20121228/90958_1 /TAXON_ID=2916 /ORGANISM="Ceratium fusus, Strain PA161109" /LENGTH=40 /DNA_ID= /DNA_START= /DNA_END= /DNA_ORIENTATION=